jgi:hypothetical protein
MQLEGPSSRHHGSWQCEHPVSCVPARWLDVDMDMWIWTLTGSGVAVIGTAGSRAWLAQQLSTLRLKPARRRARNLAFYINRNKCVSYRRRLTASRRQSPPGTGACRLRRGAASKSSGLETGVRLGQGLRRQRRRQADAAVSTHIGCRSGALPRSTAGAVREGGPRRCHYAYSSCAPCSCQLGSQRPAAGERAGELRRTIVQSGARGWSHQPLVSMSSTRSRCSITLQSWPGRSCAKGCAGPRASSISCRPAP